MIKLFLGNKTYVLLLLPIYLVCYQLLNYYFGFYDLDQSVYFGLWSSSIDLSALWSVIFASLVVLFNAFGLNLIVNRNNFYERNTYLVALTYIVFMSLFNTSYVLSGTLLLHSSMIIMTHQLFELNKREDGRKNVFNAFMFMGIGITLCPSFGFMMPLLILSVLVIRSFSLKEFFSAFVGLSIPFMYYLSFSYLTDSSFNFNVLSQNLQLEIKDFWFVIISLGVFLLLCFFAVIIKSRKTKIQTSKQIRSLIVLVMTFLIFSLYHLISFQQIDHLSLVLIPMSILLILAFLSDSYAIAANVLFYIVFAYSVIKFFLFLPTQDV